MKYFLVEAEASTYGVKLHCQIQKLYLIMILLLPCLQDCTTITWITKIMIPNNIQTRWADLQKEQQELISTLSKYSNERLNQKPADGGWSPMEVIQHLIVSEIGTLNYIQKKLSFNPKFKKAGLLQDIKSGFYNVFFRLPFKVKAPIKALTDFPEYSDFEETTKNWDNLRTDFKTLLDNLDDSLWDKQVFNHPVIGRISIYHTVAFFYEHQHRHIKQILKQF